MTSFRAPVTSSRLPSWSWIPAFVFLVLLVHGSLIGLTDDEAYYWALSRHPGWGFAFHPPGVVWAIAFFEKLLGPIFGTHSAGLVRLPSALCSSLILALGLDWIENGLRAPAPVRLGRAALVLLSFAGFFSASWMMVPDLPMFLGWMLAFRATWEVCAGRGRSSSGAMLAAGVALSVLSKYSGVAVAASSVLAIFLWAPARDRWRWISLVVLATLVAFVPSLIWNARHEWASFLYQVRDRQRGEFSLKRWGRFLAVEAALAGPSLLLFSAITLICSPLSRARSARIAMTPASYCFVWALPAFLYLVQPLWADFKPHWAFALWLPVSLLLATEASAGGARGWVRAQIGYGIPLVVIGLVLCHVPLGGLIATRALGRPPDPRLDVTNDLYGWNALRAALEREDLRGLPVIGSRYQTASQAAFALGDDREVSFIPRDDKQRDEWPDIAAVRGSGPAWPALTAPVIFVTDNRYNAGPEFSGARCEEVQRLDTLRWGLPAKSIGVWRCRPELPGSR